MKVWQFNTTSRSFIIILEDTICVTQAFFLSFSHFFYHNACSCCCWRCSDNGFLFTFLHNSYKLLMPWKICTSWNLCFLHRSDLYLMQIVGGKVLFAVISTHRFWLTAAILWDLMDLRLGSAKCAISWRMFEILMFVLISVCTKGLML